MLNACTLTSVTGRVTRVTRPQPPYSAIENRTRTLLPYDTYRLYQIERAKSPAEVQRADEQAARLISAVSSLLRGLTRPVRAIRRPYPQPLRSAHPAQHGTRPAQQDTGDSACATLPVA